MKNLKYLLAGVFLTGLLFSGCKKAEEALDVKFDATYDADINVDVPPALRNVAFSKSTTLDPASDPNVSKYFDKIKKFEIQEITGEITSISKEVTLVTGTLSIYNENRNASWTLNNVPLTKGTVLTLDDSGGGWDTVSQILKDKQVFTVRVEGEVSEGDVSFTIKIKIKTKVTASPL